MGRPRADPRGSGPVGGVSVRVRFLGCPIRARACGERPRRRGLPVGCRALLGGRRGLVRHSFAGLLDTVLGVDAEGMPGRARVWASAFSPRALAYRSRLGIGLAGLATAVVVQEIVDAAVSGVLFTRHPTIPGRRRSAGRGLGEGVVQGTAACDT